MRLTDYLRALGLQPEMHILLHTAFRKIRTAFPDVSAENVVTSIQEIITAQGSLLMPAFTYCFKKSFGEYERFDRANSPAKTGYLSEVFRQMPNVIRTASPTHSFSLWGKVAHAIAAGNSPESPLGADSVLEWLHQKPDSYVLMLGTDFTAFTFGHYLEIAAPVPWHDFSPWAYQGVEPIGVSISGAQRLKEVPGCSKAFVNFEQYLLAHEKVQPFSQLGLHGYLLSIEWLYHAGLKFFKNSFAQLLCAAGSCEACDSRRKEFL